MYLICDYRGVIVEICENPAWIKRQSNGVDVLCPENEATCLYSNDTDTYYPAGKNTVPGNRYHLETVEDVPENVTPLHWRYSAGEFVSLDTTPAPSGPEMELKIMGEQMVELEKPFVSTSAYFPSAMASLMTLSQLSLAQVSDEDTKLKVSGLYSDWAAGNHAQGEIYNTHKSDALPGDEWEQTWEVYQAYDNASNPDIIPGNSAWYTFNRPLHGKSPETARPFVPVQGAHDMYRIGEYMVFTDGKIYKCLSDTNFSPTDYPQAWEEYKEE